MKTIVYTTVYPAAIPYVNDFINSLMTAQGDFSLAIGVDGVAEKELSSFRKINKHFSFYERKQESYIQLRSRILSELAQDYDLVILCDIDDVLFSNRICKAVSAIQSGFDIHVCNMKLFGENIDEFVEVGFGDVEKISEYNFFGFSNVSLTSHVIKKLLKPFFNCKLLDWYYAFQYLEFNLRIYFDDEIGVGYRQHHDNIAKIRPQFSMNQLQFMTELVISQLEDFSSVFQANLFNVASVLKERLVELADFKTWMQNNENASLYLEKINQLKKTYFWWECVATKKLEYLWKQ